MNKKNYLKFAFVFLFLFSFYFVNAGTCDGEVGICDSDNTGICSSDSSGNPVSLACPGGTECIPGLAQCVDLKCDGEVGKCNSDSTGICSVDNSAMGGIGVGIFIPCPSETVCDSYTNTCVDPRCTGEVGRCNSDGTGICMPGINYGEFGPVISVDCLNGCTGDGVCDGRVISDSLGRTTKIDYLDNSQDVSYTYSGKSLHVIKVDVGNGQEVYTYDYNGNLLSEEYRSTPDLNTLYSYYFDNNLKRIVTGDSYTQFWYDSENRISMELMAAADIVTQMKYEYDSEDRVVKTISPLRVITYEYDVDSNLVKERSDFYDETFTEVLYDYDSDGNMIWMKDNLGNVIDYAYDKIDYACTQTVCNDEECLSYSEVESTCSYSRLKSKTTGGFKVDLEYDVDGNFLAYQSNYGSNEIYPAYTPTEAYDSNGLLIRYNAYTYAYDSDYSLKKIEDTNAESSLSLTYSDGGNLEKMTSSEGSFIESYLEPLGREVAYKYCYSGSCSFQFPIIASILPFIFRITGNAIADPGYVMMYSLEPGDEEGFVTKAEFDKAIAKYEIENGEIVEFDYSPCFETDDFSDFSYCSDESTVSEYYCGRRSIFNSELIVKESTLGCEFGCSMGACLKESITNQTVNETIPDCFDSDGGEDYFTYSFTRNPLDQTMIGFDHCENGTRLIEQICSGQGYIYYDCPNGCVDGACVAEEILDLPPEPENPERI